VSPDDDILRNNSQTPARNKSKYHNGSFASSQCCCMHPFSGKIDESCKLSFVQKAPKS